MKITYHFAAHNPKIIYFTLDEVEIMLKLLRIKRWFSTKKESSKIESLIKRLESLSHYLHEDDDIENFYQN